PGLSSVVLTFEPGTDVLDARQVVEERLTQAVGAAGLPAVARPPQMLQPLSSTNRVAMLKLSSEDQSLIDMSVLARWVIGPRLLAVDGVATVAIWGFRDQQLQVLVDPERLAERGVTLSQIIRTAGNALEVSPLSFLEASSPGTGGFIDTANQRLHVFHEQTISTPGELAQVTLEDAEGEAVAVDGQLLTLGDVTEIVEDHQPLIGDAICSNGECLLLVIEKFPDANTPDVTRGMDAAIAAMAPGLGGMEIDSSVYRPATYVEDSLNNLGRAFLIGLILVVLVLGVFFFWWRTVLISTVAVIVSLTTAGLLLQQRDAPINAMIIAGIVLAIGAIIGDAVIDVETAVRRMGQTGPDGVGVPRSSLIRQVSLEMRSSILFSAVIVAMALVPAFFMVGEAGAFFPEVAVSYLLALAASMVVALTVVPALGMILLGGQPLPRRQSPVMSWLHARYDRAASSMVARITPALAILTLVVLAGLVALPFLGTSFSPSLREGNVLIQETAPPGTSLTRMTSMTAQVVADLSSLPGVRTVAAHVGRAIASDQRVNVNSGEVWVGIDPEADYDSTLASIETVINGHPELETEMQTYSDQRIGAVLGRAGDEVVVRIYGQDLEILETKAEEVRDLVAGITGVDQPRVDVPLTEPIIEVAVDLAAAQEVGVKPGDVRRGAAVLLSGITVGNLFEDQKVFDVVVWGDPDIRETEEDVRNLMIDTPSGDHVLLGEVANVQVVPRPTVIRHESVERYMDVKAKVAGRGVNEVLADVEASLGEVVFPYEYHAAVLGGPTEQSVARSRVIFVAAAAVIGIFLLLQAAFGSWRLGVLAFLTIPMALAGGVLAALIDGATLRLGAMAGLAAVLAIGARNGILQIRRYQHLERREGQVFGPDLVIQGTREMLMPILVTAVATAVGLIPLLLFGNVAGLELVRPIA
ncbi:MAG: efflux RND transporter permease subunit, partial [Acidimicrobiia bacterium]